MTSLKSVIVLLIFIFSVHFLALVNFWYWEFWWFDIPMHFLGGFWVALTAVALISNFQFPISKEFINQKFLSFVIVILSLVALIGVFLEFSEFIYDIIFSSKGYFGIMQVGVGDTIGDLFFDLLGGLVFSILAKLKANRIKFSILDKIKKV